MAWQMHHKAVNRMRKNCSRKAYLKRVGAAVLAGTMLLAAMPGTAFAAYAPVTGNPEDTYDAETWAKLQDNVLEYDEIPDLVHVYNSSISEIWKNLRESKEKIDRNIQELDSQRGKMKNLKDEAKDQGNWTGYGNYTMQDSWQGCIGPAQYRSVQPENGGRYSEGRKADHESGTVSDDHV